MFEDRAYLERRLVEELAAADTAACPEARKAHAQLAHEFERKLRAHAPEQIIASQRV